MLKKPIQFLVLSLFVLTTLSQTLAGFPAAATNDPEIGARVDAYVKPYLAIKAFNGSILIARKGKVVFNRGYGMANYELNIPNKPQTRFHIASISKTFTAAAIMILEERGLLHVTDPLTKYIPDYPNGAKITIHHLLIHTSGIANVNDLPDYDNRARFPQTLDSIIEMFKGKPPIFQPGERYRYCNSEYNLLAYIIEKVSGKGYGQFLKESIFDPLAMNDTGHDGNAAAIIKNMASGYVPAGVSDLEKAPYFDWSIKTGNGSLYSTVEDLYKWDRALYTEKILKRATLEKIFKPHVAGVGYGWFISTKLNRKAIRMSGRSPGFQGEIHRYVDDDVCVIVLGNNYSGTASFIITDLAAIALGEKYAVPGPMLPRKDNLDAYVGKYQSGEDFFRPKAVLEIKKQGDHLGLSYWGTPPIPLSPMATAKFYDRAFGAGVTFIKNNQGEVTRMVYESGGTYELARLPDK